ncbi:MAG: insulinase family protein [Flavobacteriales bacterium]|nr:insulinase family protein [Flavobacteriales bacterium]
MKKINLFTGFILLATALMAQDITEPTFIAKYGDNELDIPYERWELPNGLTILVHEDHSDPIVYLGVTYHVGSARETHGKTGYAHFFEHMLCMGSEHAPDKGQWNFVEQAGGITNASTSFDQTNYYQVFPSNYLERIMFLESDRMGYCYNEFNQKAFEAQRGAVKNEKIERCHTPLSFLMILEKLFVNFFPPTHPYNWPIIGYVEDLDRANLDDMRNWLKRWYGPNNATLVISGDVNTKEAIALANKYFSGIPMGESVRKMRKQPVRLSSDIYTSYIDPYTGVPMNVMAFPTIPNNHKDAPAVKILAELLAGGKSSPFYQKFVKTDKAIQTSIIPLQLELSGLLLIQYVPRPSMEMYTEEASFFSEINNDIRKALNDFETEGFLDEDLERIKSQYEAAFIEGYETVEDKAGAIASYSIFNNDKINVSDELKAYLSVSREDVMRVYKKYVKNKNAVILDIKTSNPFSDRKDSLISFNPYAPKVVKSDPQYEGLEYHRPIETIDRNNPPNILDPKSVKIPEYYTDKFDNGIDVIGMYTKSPILKILINIEGGSLVENKKGVANMTASLMNEGTKNYSTEDISKELDKIGSSISFMSDRTSTTILISSLNANIDKTLEILQEKLFGPGFVEEDFDRLKKNKIQGEENIEKNRQSVGSRIFRKKIFGDNAYGGHPVKKDIKKIKIKDLQKYYETNYSPSVTDLVIVSQFRKEEVLGKLDFLKKWKAKEVSIPSNFDFPKTESTQIFICDFPGATQSSVYVGHKSLKFDYNGESFKNKILNYPLGGNGLTSRLSKIREEGGETYGIGSYFSGDKYGGSFGIVSNISTKGTVKSIAEIITITQEYINNGVKQEELNLTKQNMINSELMGYESNYEKLFLLLSITSNDLPKDYSEQQKVIINSMQRSNIDELAKKSIKPDEFIIVIAGNKYVIQDELKGLGYKITEIKY